MIIDLYCGDIKIGAMPATALLTNDGVPGFDDVINSWALFTAQTAPTTSIAGMFNLTFPDLLANAFASADDFRIQSAQQTDKEIVVVGGEKYYVLDKDSHDFGLLELTLQSVEESDKQDSETLELDTIEQNAKLLSDYLNTKVKTAFTPTKRVVGPAVAAPATTPHWSNYTVPAHSAASLRGDAPTKELNRGDVTIAPGFFGTAPKVNVNKPATLSPAEEARLALGKLLRGEHDWVSLKLPK